MSWSTEVSEPWNHVLEGHATAGDKTKVVAEIVGGVTLASLLAFELIERGSLQRFSKLTEGVSQLPKLSLIDRASNAIGRLGRSELAATADLDKLFGTFHKQAPAAEIPIELSFTSMTSDDKLLDAFGRDVVSIKRPDGGELRSLKTDPQVAKFLEENPLSLAQLTRVEKEDFIRAHYGMDQFRVHGFHGERTKPSAIDADTFIGRTGDITEPGVQLFRDTVLRRDLRIGAEHAWRRLPGGKVQFDGLKVFDFDSGSVTSYRLEASKGREEAGVALMPKSDQGATTYLRTQIFHSGRASASRLSSVDGATEIDEFVKRHYDEAAGGMALKPLFDLYQRLYK